MWKKIASLFKRTFMREEIRIDHLDTDKGQIQTNGAYKPVSSPNHFHQFGCFTFSASAMIITFFLARIMTIFCVRGSFEKVVKNVSLDGILMFLCVIPDVAFGKGNPKPLLKIYCPELYNYVNGLPTELHVKELSSPL